MQTSSASTRCDERTRIPARGWPWATAYRSATRPTGAGGWRSRRHPHRGTRGRGQAARRDRSRYGHSDVRRPGRTAERGRSKDATRPSRCNPALVARTIGVVGRERGCIERASLSLAVQQQPTRCIEGWEPDICLAQASGTRFRRPRLPDFHDGPVREDVARRCRWCYQRADRRSSRPESRSASGADRSRRCRRPSTPASQQPRPCVPRGRQVGAFQQTSPPALDATAP